MGVSYRERVRNELANHSGFLEGRESETDVVRFIPGVSAYNYAMQQYAPYVLRHMPNVNVQHYMLGRKLPDGRKPRVLSLGCGTGDWEFALARQAPEQLEFELVDLNARLMEAAKRLAVAENLPLTTRAADVNTIELEPVSYDFVLCRSSLHHFLELERVFGEIRKGLRPGGAFIVVGEWVGRNGLQLYPETERAAQAIFDTLPDRLRKNAYTGEIDRTVPNIDHSASSFEAIRSEEIMPVLLRFFEPVEHVLYDAYISLLLDFRYGPNYDLENPEDRALVEQIVRSDQEAIETGALRPTAMFGIFRC